MGEPLAAAGHAVATVVGQGWGGFKDGALFPGVVAAGEFLVTADKGFGDIRRYPPGSHPGILVLRPDPDSVLALRALVVAVLAAVDLAALAGCVTVASPRSIRVRRPPGR